jgi:hypothetical protein
LKICDTFERQFVLISRVFRSATTAPSIPMSTPSSQNSTGGPEDIAPELLERLLLRKLDMLERDYATTLRAHRHSDNDGVDVEIAALRLQQQQQQHDSSGSAAQPVMTTKSSSAVSAPDELSFDFPAPPAAPLPQGSSCVSIIVFV